MSASSSSRRSLATRRRSSGAGNKLLGAVKLHSPLGAGSDAGEGGRRRLQAAAPLRLHTAHLAAPPLPAPPAGSPCSTASDVSALATPQDRSPLVVSRAAATAPAAAAAPAAADALAQFGQQLASSRSSDRWLEERLASPGGKGGAGEQDLQRLAGLLAKLRCCSSRLHELPTTSTPTWPVALCASVASQHACWLSHMLPLALPLPSPFCSARPHTAPARLLLCGGLP